MDESGGENPQSEIRNPQCCSCGGSGRIALDRCPLSGSGPEIWDAVEAAEFLGEHGLPPAAGGLHDQTACFLEAARATWSEQAKVKNRETRNP